MNNSGNKYDVLKDNGSEQMNPCGNCVVILMKAFKRGAYATQLFPVLRLTAMPPTQHPKVNSNILHHMKHDLGVEEKRGGADNAAVVLRCRSW